MGTLKNRNPVAVEQLVVLRFRARCKYVLALIAAEKKWKKRKFTCFDKEFSKILLDFRFSIYLCGMKNIVRNTYSFLQPSYGELTEYNVEPKYR